jgi:4-hydroxy-4-methyl-2-oxoglutarate aldolase
MKHKIIKNISRPSAEAVKTLGELGVATVHEAQGRQGLMLPVLRPIYPTAKVSGTAVTVLCQPGDNLMIHAALDVVKQGDILVITTTSESNDGMFGELLATSCQVHGVVGLIIDAGIRDVADLTAMNFPVWAKAIHAQGTVKATPGSVNVPIVCAEQAVNAGDVIVADIDGVCVVQKEDADEVAKLGLARLEKEKATRERLKKGELGLDFYGLREKLEKMGVVWIEEENDG